jgi:hypothetical protein
VGGFADQEGIEVCGYGGRGRGPVGQRGSVKVAVGGSGRWGRCSEVRGGNFCFQEARGLIGLNCYPR